MTHVCCPSCRLRFTRAAAAYLAGCPECGNPPQPMSSPERLIGFRLFTHDESRDAFLQAIAIKLPVPTRHVER